MNMRKEMIRETINVVLQILFLIGMIVSMFIGKIGAEILCGVMYLAFHTNNL